MSPSALALLGYATWTLVLVTAIALHRSLLTLTGARLANSFSPDGADVSPFAGRLCRVHANCYEFFPVFGGVLAVSLLTDSVRVTDSLALGALSARLLQSGVHLWSVTPAAVTLRFVFFAIQVGIVALWTFRLWGF